MKRIDHLYQPPEVKDRNFILHHGDLTDSSSLINIIQTTRPDEIYNLGAQSHVQISYQITQFTSQTNAMGVLNFLESVRQNSSNSKIETS